LRNVGKKAEPSFPKFIHDEHFMRRVAMQKEGLAEKRQIPMKD
jgi:hypothetical protein